MVQLCPCPVPDTPVPAEENQEDPLDPVPVDGPEILQNLQLNLETSTCYYGYENYIEDGLICLKHKIRNLAKKKVRCF